ncbi:MAG: hypothetical protein OER90_17310 [Gemmatimonadota bacterium]|nr:hypothetical protein [Gemmatimonadota bacterium]
MLQLDLSRDELQILEDVLDSYLSDLRMEIADTDRKDFRDSLKERKRVLNAVLEVVRREGGPAHS